MSITWELVGSVLSRLMAGGLNFKLRVGSSFLLFKNPPGDSDAAKVRENSLLKILKDRCYSLFFLTTL